MQWLGQRTFVKFLKNREKSNQLGKDLTSKFKFYLKNIKLGAMTANQDFVLISMMHQLLFSV